MAAERRSADAHGCDMVQQPRGRSCRCLWNHELRHGEACGSSCDVTSVTGAEDLARESALGLATIRRAENSKNETSMTAANGLSVRRARTGSDYGSVSGKGRPEGKFSCAESSNLWQADFTNAGARQAQCNGAIRQRGRGRRYKLATHPPRSAKGRVGANE